MEKIKIGDVVVVSMSDGSEAHGPYHAYTKGKSYIVTKVHEFNRLRTTDPSLGRENWNSWGTDKFQKATKLDHILLGVMHSSKDKS